MPMRPLVSLTVSLLFLVVAAITAGGPYQGQPAPAVASSGGSPGVQQVKVQVETARTHAAFAAGGDSISYVHQHLGHALNCLEGPKGRNFQASWGNVCQGQGNGILVDLKAVPNNSSLMALARQAGASALQGLKKESVSEAKPAAKKTAGLLQQLGDRLK
jgi:hypothetical protein